MGELVGVGLYSVREAARLTGARERQIRRWLFGYSFKTKASDRAWSAPLWKTEFSEEADFYAIGFHDLLEVRFVDAFTTRGVSLQVIRRASAKAKNLFRVDYPFTSLLFRTDGRSIFYEALGEEDPKLFDLLKSQRVFDEVIRPSLYEGIEFKDSVASRWFPLGRDHSVVLDPLVSFGKPVVEGFGVPTEMIAATVNAEGDTKRAAQVFELPLHLVKRAVEFERRLAA
jgi:uncharacterized protein (DUF433 family)